MFSHLFPTEPAGIDGLPYITGEEHVFRILDEIEKQVQLGIGEVLDLIADKDVVSEFIIDGLRY